MNKLIARLGRYFIPQFAAFRIDRDGVAVAVDEIAAVVPVRDETGAIDEGKSVLKLKSDEDVIVPYSVTDVMKAFHRRWSNVLIVGQIETS